MEKIKTIQMSLLDNLDVGDEFTTQTAYDIVINQSGIDAKKPSIRARIYEAIDKGFFESKSEGVYLVKKKDVSCVVVQGDGRDLSWIKDNTIDALITDHPYFLPLQNKGGNRDFTSTYDTFIYTQHDFNEKARVLKQGCFLVEFLPEESSTNYEYIYQIKSFAKNAGFEYYAKVAWIKGDFVANTGRKSKNVEDIMIFSNGPARKLRLDAKANKALGLDKSSPDTVYMSGTKGMLPTAFYAQPPSKNERIHQAEKPLILIEQLIEFITKEGETILDQFAGSGVVGEASLKSNRNSILIEFKDEFVRNIQIRLSKYDNELNDDGSICYFEDSLEDDELDAFNQLNSIGFER